MKRRSFPDSLDGLQLARSRVKHVVKPQMSAKVSVSVSVSVSVRPAETGRNRNEATEDRCSSWRDRTAQRWCCNSCNGRKQPLRLEQGGIYLDLNHVGLLAQGSGGGGMNMCPVVRMTRRPRGRTSPPVTAAGIRIGMPPAPASL